MQLRLQSHCAASPALCSVCLLKLFSGVELLEIILGTCGRKLFKGKDCLEDDFGV